MAIQKNAIIKIDLEDGNIHRSFANRAIGMGDNTADRFGIEVMNNGEPVRLTSASCVGYFIRSDGITLVINGQISGNTAYVELPEAAYAVEGNYTLAIKVSGTGYTDTLRIVDGTVIKTTSGAIADPEQEIPSLEDLMAVIGRAEAAADEIDGISIAATQITGTRYKIAVTKE